MDRQASPVSQPAPGASSTGIDGADLSPRVYLATFLAGALFFALNENFALSGDAALYADYASGLRRLFKSDAGLAQARDAPR